MKAVLLAADGVEDCELLYPLYRFREEGIETHVAGPSKASVTGKHGYTIDPDLTFGQVRAEDFDILIIPGGRAPETMRLDEHVVKVTREMLNAGKVVGAVCHGAQVLISAGVLKGRRATCWKGVRDDLKAAGAEYSDREVVVDGSLVTSRRPEDLPAFCREVFKLLHGPVRMKRTVEV